MKTCAEVAAELFHYHTMDVVKHPELAQTQSISLWAWMDKFKECSDFPQPKKKKQVWQWRTKDKDCSFWKITDFLSESYQPCSGQLAEKHAGPFEVDE